MYSNDETLSEVQIQNQWERNYIIVKLSYSELQTVVV